MTSKNFQKVWKRTIVSHASEMVTQRKVAVNRIQELEEKMAPINNIFSTETMKEMVQCKVANELFQNLETKYGFKPEMLDEMFEAARVCS